MEALPYQLAGIHFLQYERQIVKRSRKEIEVSIEELYLLKVKPIYSKITEYATWVQSKFSVSQEKTKQLAQIKLANRNIVESIKALEQTRENMNQNLISDNQYLLT